MKSSDRRRRTATLVAVVVVGLSALGITTLQRRLSASFHALETTSDVYALPSPDRTIVASLGYRAGVADLLYAHVLVSYGLHIVERRRFEFVGKYLDTINALDPTFRDPYRYADTLLTLQGQKPTQEDYLKAREILERGMEALPYDADLHRNAGQYLAYLSWPHVPEERQKEWRTAGARYLARSCELLGNDATLPYHCITAATLFNRLGEHEAMIDFLQRVQVIADTPEVRDMAANYLSLHLEGQERARAEARSRRFQEAWSNDFRFVSRNLLLAVGPAFDEASCAGRTVDETPDCTTSWRAWHALRERNRGP